ncbi:hypothetical protein B0H63DRAFT_26597 [Podospora didyma]|uniref:Uncharacterized protein n=1 Tax=Podospora didyma TaxID=330526 RepID=A0AAE0U7X5_9PEZI|nr:hypothetical protein B0H63DRAFT_26597 [Podospora didyma]
MLNQFQEGTYQTQTPRPPGPPGLSGLSCLPGLLEPSGPPEPGRAGTPVTATGMLRGLQSIPLPPATEVPGATDTAGRPVLLDPWAPVSSGTGVYRQPNPYDRADFSSPDWTEDSRYKGSTQPPLAIRLRSVINFLSEEDSDRCMYWNQRFREAYSYLKWLGEEDEQRQLGRASQQTQDMFRDALDKAKAHLLFQKHSYDPSPLEIVAPPKLSYKSNRLAWARNARDWPVPSGKPAPGRDSLLPRPLYARIPQVVNTMLVETPDNENLFEQYREDDNTVWTTAEAPPVTSSHVEAEVFARYSIDHTQWVNQDPSRKTTALPDGSYLKPGDASDWVMERGARRAGLQSILRSFDPVKTEGRWRRLVLPPDAATISKVYTRTDGVQWEPIRLSSKQMPAQLDTMPFNWTVTNYMDYRTRLRKMILVNLTMKAATETVEPLLLSKNVVNGGPYLRPMSSARIQSAQWRLNQCYTVFKVLEEGCRRVERDLLKAMIERVNRGLNDAKTGSWDCDENAVTVPELDLIKFVASSESVNTFNWKGPFDPEFAGKKYKLFQVFARRIRNLFNDKDPDAIFRYWNSQVDVEELLEVINAGEGQGAVNKTEFEPFQACFWLDRLHRSGHVTFHLDPEYYGIVERPYVDCFPEHRIVFDADGYPIVPTDEEHIRSWKDVIERGRPDTGEDSSLYRFLCDASYNLGFSISLLERILEAEPPETPASLDTRLDGEMRDFEALCQEGAKEVTLHTLPELVKWITMADRDEPAPTQTEALSTIRERIISEMEENETMLAPGRVSDIPKREMELVRDHDWSFASVNVSGVSPRFCDINRWPLGVGYLSDKAEQAVKDDKHLNRDMTFDPTKLDPVPVHFQRPKLQPYTHPKTVLRHGPALYPVGDTKAQQKVVRDTITNMANLAVFGEAKKRAWGEMISDVASILNPKSIGNQVFGRRLADTLGPKDGDPAGEAWLPEVAPKMVPQSWDPPVAGNKRQRIDTTGRARTVPPPGGGEEQSQQPTPPTTPRPGRVQEQTCPETPRGRPHTPSQNQRSQRVQRVQIDSEEEEETDYGG